MLVVYMNIKTTLQEEGLFLIKGLPERLFSRSRDNAHIGASVELTGKVTDFLALELYGAICKRHKRVVAGAHNVLARVKLCATLTNDNIACLHLLVAIDFDTKALGNRIATKGCRTARFTCCHSSEDLRP